MRGKVGELSRQLSSRDEQVSEMRAAQEITKQESEHHRELATTLRQHVAECESRHGGLENAAINAEQRLTTLQQEHGDARRLIQQLEAQIRLQHRC